MIFSFRVWNVYVYMDTHIHLISNVTYNDITDTANNEKHSHPLPFSLSLS